VLAALLARQIDAAPLDDVTAKLALKQNGFHVLLDMADPKLHLRTAFSVVAFRNDFIQRADIAQRMVDSLVQGMAYMRAHKAEAEAVIKTKANIDDPAELDSVYTRQIQLMATDPAPAQDEFADAISFVPKGTQPISASEVAASIDPRLAQNAAKYLGG
jgi:ABC-type nitrate/sulfonate/bicarbonate transport system substrate-binding protein